MIMNPAGPASGGALFAEMGHKLVSGNGFDAAAFQVVIAAVKHFPRLRQFLEISGKGVLGQFLRAASGFRNPTVDLCLQVRVVEVQVHASTIRENRVSGKCRKNRLNLVFGVLTGELVAALELRVGGSFANRQKLSPGAAAAYMAVVAEFGSEFAVAVEF
ncbi:MAG TPA: hypothetical protein VG345_11765 [Bryobacteraceae bacterium]|nr:hypothetical protein [Bryobacteraceae bacterium]